MTPLEMEEIFHSRLDDIVTSQLDHEVHLTAHTYLFMPAQRSSFHAVAETEDWP